MKIFRSSFVKSFLALLSVHAGTLVGGTLLPIAMARIVGAQALGIFATASSFGLLLLAVVDWGYETRLPLLVSQTPEGIFTHINVAQRAKTRLWLLATLICAVGYGIFILVRGNVIASQSLLYLALPTLLYGAWALTRALAMTYSHALRGLQHFGIIARVENSLTFASHLLAMGVLAAPSVISSEISPSLVVSAVVVCLIAGEALKSIVFVRYLKNENKHTSERPDPPSSSISSSVIPLSIEHLVFVMVQALSIVQSRAGIYALTLLATQVEVGYFSAVARFTIALRILPGALFNVLLPRFVRSPQPETLGKALLLGVCIGAMGSAALYVCADGLIWLIYGERFAHLVPLLRIISWLFLLQTLVNILEPYLLAHKLERFVNGTLAVALCAFVGICVLLPVDTAYRAAFASVGLEIILVVAYAVKSLTLLPQKKSALML